MQIDEIIAQLDSEIARLQQARSLLAATTYKRGPGSSGKVLPGENAGTTVTDAAGVVKKKRTLSPEGLARIAAAQKKRWAKVKKAAK
jgi:hypothetical protein